MTSGMIAATTAPNAISRITNVSGIVSRSEASSPPLISSWISSFVSVLLSAWIRSSGVGGLDLVDEGRARLQPGDERRRRRRGPGRRSGRSCGRGTRGPPPAAPCVGSTSWSTRGRSCRRPSIRARRAGRRCRVIAARYAGSSTVPSGRRDDQEELLAEAGPPPRLDRRVRGTEDHVGLGRLVLRAGRRSRPPRRSRCRRPRGSPANSPIVPTNQRTKTSQRWRALQSATRTVQGGLLTTWAGAEDGVGSDTAGSLPRRGVSGRRFLGHAWLSIWARCSRPLKST